jgi:Xaa-Pro dipeptidase
VFFLQQSIGIPQMSDTRLDVLHPVLRSTGLDAIAIVPGANFRRIFHHDFHQNERPLVVIARREHAPIAIVPNLEMGSFAALDFKGEVYDWRDETGYQSAFEAAARHLEDVRTIGVEGQTMRVFVALALNEALPGARLVDIHATISSIRLHKQAADVALIRKAIELSEAALEATLGEIRVGMTETEVEAVLLRNLFACGSDGLAFGPIVAAGDNSAKPHAKARPDYRIKRGDSLLFDFGGAYGGYCADITRTFFVQEVSPRDRDFYNTVLAANEAGRAASRPGATAHHVDDVVQKVLEGSPFAQYRRHKTGHGLGLEVHEDPYIMRGNHSELEPGMVFTVEPGLYRMGEAGVRIEDDMLVTAEGAESLTSFSRELRLVG